MKMTDQCDLLLDSKEDVKIAEYIKQGHLNMWKPIESAPRDGTWILVFGNQFVGRMAVVCWDEDYNWWCVDDGKDYEISIRGQEPTYWDNMPELP